MIVLTSCVIYGSPGKEGGGLPEYLEEHFKVVKEAWEGQKQRLSGRD